MNITQKIIMCSVSVIVILIVGASFFMKNFSEPKIIIKTAVKENALSDKNYILCKQAVTTGFNWIMVKNEDGQTTQTYCNIAGAQPFTDINLKHEFSLADNTFVFYVEEKNMVYSEATSQNELEYVVTGWDILYPVKHSELFVFDLFKTKKHIIEDDLK